MKKTTAFFAAFAATFGAFATDYVWTGSAGAMWNEASNWTVDGSPADDYPKSADDTAIFNQDSNPHIDPEVTVGKIVLNGNLTHIYDKWLTFGAAEGSGKLILRNRGRIRNISGTALNFTNDLEITATDFTDCSNHSAAPYIQGNNAAFIISGRLLGDGDVFLTMSGYYGVHLAGDNSGFTGTVHVDQNSSNRMMFDSAQAGLKNGTLIIHGDANDNGTMTFSNGTIEFGALRTDKFVEGAKFRSINKYNTLIVGALNGEDSITLGMGDNDNAHAKIIKVGTGTLELGPTRHRDGTIISNGTVRVTHADGICHQNSSLTFAGGTLEYGEHSGIAVTKDVSAHVTGSTGYISVNTGTNHVTWANSAIYNSNTEAMGFEKKGSGTLTLSGTNRDGAWQMFSNASKTNRIEDGVLEIQNAKYNSRYTLESTILGSGTLRIRSEEANGGIWLHGTENLADFEGTLEWANVLDEGSYASGLRMADNINFEMPKAKLRITGDPAQPTRIMKVETQWNENSAHVTVGAFDHLSPNALIYTERSGWTLNILGVAGDSFLNGPFDAQKIFVVKSGADSLTLGDGFDAVDGSSITVNAGTLRWSRTTDLPQGIALTIANGVLVGGSGTIPVSRLSNSGGFALSTDELLTVDGAVDLAGKTLDIALPETLDTGADYPLLAATSITGQASAVCPALETLNADTSRGRWKLSVVANGGGIFSSCATRQRG